MARAHRPVPSGPAVVACGSAGACVADSGRVGRVRSTGISLQAMDNSHVALVALLMRQDGFEHYRCGEYIAPPCVARVCRCLRALGAIRLRCHVRSASDDGA